MAGRLVHSRSAVVPAAEQQPYAIELKGVSVRFGRGQQQVTVLNDLSFSVAHGEQVLVQGASGSGKTTMLNVVRGIQPADEGTVRVNGVEHSGRHFFGAPKGTRGISYVPQHLALPTAHRLVTVATLQARMSGVQPDNARLQQLLEGFGLQDVAMGNPYVGELSGGQQARVAVVAQLMTEHSILLLDEPASPLDRDARQQFGSQLGQTCRSLGTTALVISHDPLDGFASMEVTMRDGRLQTVSQVGAVDAGYAI